ncbi:hypothetical protein Tco_1057394 [Tanacetum coccineum]|uniref:Uncharacterized protein n=1 Tax=Tanacetum coccineum TaxID=301880 RepID=A0ABQ5H714_9ASTR
MLDEGDNWGIDPLEFLLNINTSFKNHKKVDGRTKKVLLHSWMNGNWNKRYVDNSIFSSNERKESKYENPPDTTTDSFFKAYDIRDIEEKNGQGQLKCKDDNWNDNWPNKKDLVNEISTNIGGEFTNLEILKCWSLETSRRLCNTQSCSTNLHGESTEQISGKVLYKVEDIATYLVEYVKYGMIGKLTVMGTST